MFNESGDNLPIIINNVTPSLEQIRTKQIKIMNVTIYAE